jgi:hypothetical protein
MCDIPQHATLAQMRAASAKLTNAAQRMGLDPLPVQAPWQARVWQVQRSMVSLPFTYMAQDNRAAIEPGQPPPKLSRWASFKQWLGGNMRKI